MAHFALLDGNNKVQAVFYGRDEDNENDLSLRTGQTYKRTSYNTKGGKYYEWRDGIYQLALDQSKAFRKNYAGIGYTYDSNRDAFIAPAPFSTWVLNETTCGWEPPFPSPELSEQEFNDSKKYRWDEAAYLADNTQGWVMIQFNPETRTWDDI
jgi:hypothetical protein